MKTKLGSSKWGLLLLVLAPLSVGFGYFFTAHQTSSDGASIQEERVLTKPLETPEVYPYKIKPGATLYQALRELNVAPVTIHQIVEAAAPISDLGQLRAGTEYQISQKGEELEEIKFRFSPVEMLEVTRAGQTWAAKKIDVKVESRIITFSGKVESTLWESAAAAQMDPNLISDLAEIFAWQVDFAREVRVNDRWRLSVEQKLAHGQPFGWGKILAAEYENAGQLYRAVLFRVDGKDLGYFAPDGSSLRRMFLKSPLKFGRITSRFNRKRFHPILKIRRPHLGVDYGAPRGTPIRVVGDGTVIVVGLRGGAGNMVKVRHNSVYQTAYKHMSGFARGIRSGVRVHQGQIIGYVGSTGMSTGPHLHFEFYRNGSYVDPLGQTFPSADPVPANLLAQFKQETPVALGSLPAWKSGDVSMRTPAAASEEEKPGQSF